MKNTTLLTSLLLLLSCASVKPTATHSSACTNCPAERNAFWNRWLTACAPGNTASSIKADWSHTTFRTVGVTYEGFQTEDSLDYVAMVNLYDSKESAQKYLPGVILSGSDYPDQATIKKGGYLTKLVKVGANISGFSVYYITPDELKRLTQHPSRIEQELGLPLTSNAGVYVVYRMYALTDNVVFQSQVAPTVQYAVPGEVVYWTCGGATQTLVIDNGNTTRWAKDTIPSDTLRIHVLPDIDQTADRNK